MSNQTITGETPNAQRRTPIVDTRSAAFDLRCETATMASPFPLLSCAETSAFD